MGQTVNAINFITLKLIFKMISHFLFQARKTCVWVVSTTTIRTIEMRRETQRAGWPAANWPQRPNPASAAHCPGRRPAGGAMPPAASRQQQQQGKQLLLPAAACWPTRRWWGQRSPTDGAPGMPQIQVACARAAFKATRNHKKCRYLLALEARAHDNHIPSVFCSIIFDR